MAKLMVSMGDENFRLLCLEARERGISVQELIRAVLVPDWIRSTNLAGFRRESETVQASPVLRKENAIPIVGRLRP